MKQRFLVALSLVALTFLLPVAPAAADDLVATLQPGASYLSFVPQMDYQSVVLTVRGPKEVLVQRHFDAGQTPTFDLFDRAGNALPDGSYTFELRVRPVIDAQAQAALNAARQRGDDSVAQQLRDQNRLPEGSVVQYGHFTLAGGAIVNGDEQEHPATASEASSQASRNERNAGDDPSILTEADQVIADDLIVQMSLCVGMDCVNGESFGFDTIRLKENNLRIKFQDTSNSGSFPSVDWQLTANDSTNGGANKFSIDDIDAGRTPFTIEHSAPSNSLYVDDGGRIGMGTATPVVQVHVVDGNTPTLRLEQDGSSGFTAQTWDVAGNEANYFVRDVTGGSKLPFRIQPGAPTNSIYIENTGDVGLGTLSPDAAIDIVRATGAQANLIQLNNSGPPAIQFVNTSSGRSWQFRLSDAGLVMDNDANDADLLFLDNGQLRIDNSLNTRTFDLDQNGNVVITGTLTQNSDVNSKRDFSTVSGSDVLSKVMALPITTWSFKNDDPAVRHMGPMAQDFYAAFGLGMAQNRLAPVDVDGVSLAAIQELNRRLEAKDAELQNLQQRLAALEALLTQQQQ